MRLEHATPKLIDVDIVESNSGVGEVGATRARTKACCRLSQRVAEDSRLATCVAGLTKSTAAKHVEFLPRPFLRTICSVRTWGSGDESVG